MLEKNTNLIIGKTASGKTRGILLKEAKEIIDNNENILFIDNKAEYYGTYAEKLNEMGYSLILLNLQEPENSNGWNPLMLPYNYYINGKIDKSIELINELALEIFKSDNRNSDPFWENAAADYFTSLVLLLFKKGKKEEINLGSIQVMLSSSSNFSEYPKLITEYFKNLDPTDIIYMLASPTAFAPNETKESIISVMRQKLNDFFMRPSLLQLLNTNEVKLSELNNKTAIFIIGKTIINSLANIMINQVVSAAINKKIKFNFILDNFDTLPTLLNFNDLIENATHNGFKINVAIRDIDEIKEKYGNYVLNRFASIIEVNGNEELVEIGNYNKYPMLKTTELQYFDFSKHLDEIKQ